MVASTTQRNIHPAGTLNLSGTGAVYYRVSTDKQDADRQRHSVERCLTAHGVTVAKQNEFEDMDWARDMADERPEFQRLIAAAEQGRVRWILVDRPDRFGCKNKFQLVSYIYRLQKARCRLYTVDGKELTAESLLAFFELGMEAERSEGEQREKSARVLEAKIKQAKAGKWPGGHVPYGMDVVCLDLDGTEKWRVEMVGRDLRVKINPDGTRHQHNGPRNFPASEIHDTLQLRPSHNPDKLDVVRSVFEQFATEATNYNQIVKRLNKLGIPNQYAPRWKPYHVRAMLANPIYVGRQSFNKVGQGRFFEFIGNERRPVEKATGDRRRSRADWMLSGQLFPAVIDADTWEKVQAKLAANPAKRRAPKSAQLWLAGLVHCAGCGRPMRGYTRSEQQNRFEYICSTYAEGTPGCTCQRNAVQHSVVERYVREYLSETSQLWDDFDGTAVLKGDAADEWADLYKRCADAYMDMQRMVQGGLDNLTGLLHVNAELESGKQPAEGAALVAAYRAKLEEAQGPVRDRLKELEAEHDRITNGLMNLPPGSRAMAKMQARLTEVEAQINEVEAKLTNRADELENTRRELLKLATDWQEAAEAVNTDSSARRKAEAVRKVVAKIVLTFKPTGKRHPTSDLAFVEFITHGGDSTGSVDVTPKCPNSDLSTPCTSPPASTSTTTSRA